MHSLSQQQASSVPIIRDQISRETGQQRQPSLGMLRRSELPLQDHMKLISVDDHLIESAACSRW
jgi:hypothetical protein